MVIRNKWLGGKKIEEDYKPTLFELNEKEATQVVTSQKAEAMAGEFVEKAVGRPRKIKRERERIHTTHRPKW